MHEPGAPARVRLGVRRGDSGVPFHRACRRVGGQQCSGRFGAEEDDEGVKARVEG